MSNRSLINNTIVYALGNFGSKILAFLLIPLYSYYLSKEDFGYYDILITGINLLIPFITFQVSDSIFRWLLTSKKNEEQLKIITNGLILLLFNLLLGIVCSILLFLIYPLKSHWLVTIVGLGAMIYPTLQQIARGLGYSKMFAFSGVIYALVFLLGNIVLLVYFKLSIDALFISNIFAYGVSILFLVRTLKIQKYIKWNGFNFGMCKELINYSIPLIPNTISWWLINSANKYIILLFIGVSANGIFAMSSRFSVILVMVNQVFTLAWQEQAIRDYEEKSNVFDNKVLKYLIKIQFSLVVILSLSSQFIGNYILASEYKSSWYYMPILYLGVAFLSLSGYYGAFYLGAKKTKSIFLTTLFSGIISLFLGYLLVPYLNLFGVAVSVLVGYFILFFVRVFDSKNIVKLNFPYFIFFKYFMIVVLSFFIAYMESIRISSFTILFFIIYSIFDNKIELRYIYGSLLKKVKKK